MHIIKVTEPVTDPEHGLLLGNGDLSASIYQKPDMLVWRFGKNDVWDRRLDLSDGVKPAHIDEIKHGIRNEGWVSHSYVYSNPKAKRKIKNPKRMKELCNGYPPYAHRPYPCPKPVGELGLRLLVDEAGLNISQKLYIEKGEAEIVCSWANGVKFRLLCYIPPQPNVLVIKWSVENWVDAKTTVTEQPPAWFSLYRWADSHIAEFGAWWHLHGAFTYFDASINDNKATPLPHPSLKKIHGRPVVEQTFYPDLEFKQGFKYALAPFPVGLPIKPMHEFGRGSAVLHIKPTRDVRQGWLAVAVPTSTDKGGMSAELKRVSGRLRSKPINVMKQWRKDTHASAKAFWSKSSVAIDDPVLENTWYGTLHGRRCAFRADVVAPGLALPSTLQDYSMWHGDYHTNYNYQQPFWGDYMANHVDLGDSFFPGMKHMVELGRKLARKYWNARGTFIQLLGFPFPLKDDPYGTGGICRMAYMTGWISDYYWWRYLYTLDKKWLKAEGYPVIKDCALFYLDFLEKWSDGKYHAFPSVQGESFFTGNPKDYTDRHQVIRHTRYCLQSAIKASAELNTDQNLRAQWQERLDNLVVVDDLDKLGFSAEEKRRYRLNQPEFISDPFDLSTEASAQAEMMKNKPAYLNRARSSNWTTSVSGVVRSMFRHLHNRAFQPDRDVKPLRDILERWSKPNGIPRGMCMGDTPYIGNYVEGMGILGPLQEMMLQSWDGVIRVFPAWPKKIKAHFTTLRAEGAFLISAAWKPGTTRGKSSKSASGGNGRVAGPISIISEAGQLCCVANPWPGKTKVTTQSGRLVKTTQGPDHSICFKTVKGGRYKLQPTHS